MVSPLSRNALLAQLRADIAGVDGQTRRGTALPFGIPFMDERLAEHGLCDAALHEFAPASADLAVEAAATLFVAGIAARFGERRGSVVWAVSHFDLYSPGLEQAGLAPARLLYVEAHEDAQVLAVMEDALRHGSLAAVVGEVRRSGMTAARRLQLAATEGRTPALLFRRWRRNGVCPLSEPSAAMTRWRIDCAPGPVRDKPGVGRPHWSIELVRQRNGDPFTLTVEACDAKGRLALPATITDRASAPAEAATVAA